MTNKYKTLGKDAFKNGLKMIPALDSNLMQEIKGLKIGQGVKPMKQWVQGYIAASLNDGV
jgi:hypothetical protein